MGTEVPPATPAAAAATYPTPAQIARIQQEKAAMARRVQQCVLGSSALAVYNLFLFAGIGLWIAGSRIQTNGVKIWDGKMELAGMVATSILIGGGLLAVGYGLKAYCWRNPGPLPQGQGG